MSFLVRRRIPLFVAVLFACVPRPAHADGYVDAGLGISFGSPSTDGRANVVAAIGWLPPREPIGVEIDATYAPSFFKNPGSFAENRLTTVMGNVVVAGLGEDRFGPGGRRGRFRRGAELRPYVSGGFGLMTETVQTNTPATSISNKHLGVNGGLGVMAMPANSFGLRLDVRYFQDLVGSDSANATGIDFGSFHFWRGSVGAVVTF